MSLGEIIFVLLMKMEVCLLTMKKSIHLRMVVRQRRIEEAVKSVIFPWMKCMAVCYDLRFPEMFQQMPLDTNVIFLIANWPESRIRQWHSLLTARAIEMSSYVVGVNRTGEGDGIQYTKSSAAYAPDGSMISPDSKKWNDYVTLDFSKEVFQKTIFSRSDRRPEIYQG